MSLNSQTSITFKNSIASNITNLHLLDMGITLLQGSDVRIEHSSFSSMEQDETMSYGAAIRVEDSTATITQSEFNCNAATSGGAIAFLCDFNSDWGLNIEVSKNTGLMVNDV